MIRFKVRSVPTHMHILERQPLRMGVQDAIVVGQQADPYEGPYKVTPAVDAQTLATAQKYMKEDVHIMAIPVYDVGNTSGGVTVYIATMGEEPKDTSAALGQAVLGKMILGVS